MPFTEFDPKAVTSRVELAEFAARLAQAVGTDLEDEVENPTTDRYLEALSAWVRDSGHEAARWPLTADPPRWSDIAQILLAGVFYE